MLYDLIDCSHLPKIEDNYLQIRESKNKKHMIAYSESIVPEDSIHYEWYHTLGIIYFYKLNIL